jgi:hypothetical protein
MESLARNWQMADKNTAQIKAIHDKRAIHKFNTATAYKHYRNAVVLYIHHISGKALFIWLVRAASNT